LKRLARRVRQRDSTLWSSSSAAGTSSCDDEASSSAPFGSCRFGKSSNVELEDGDGDEDEDDDAFMAWAQQATIEASVLAPQGACPLLRLPMDVFLNVSLFLGPGDTAARLAPTCSSLWQRAKHPQLWRKFFLQLPAALQCEHTDHQWRTVVLMRVRQRARGNVHPCVAVGCACRRAFPTAALLARHVTLKHTGAEESRAQQGGRLQSQSSASGPGSASRARPRTDRVESNASSASSSSSSADASSPHPQQQSNKRKLHACLVPNCFHMEGVYFICIPLVRSISF
jgi:hypothetical protein